MFDPARKENVWKKDSTETANLAYVSFDFVALAEKRSKDSGNCEVEQKRESREHDTKAAENADVIKALLWHVGLDLVHQLTMLLRDQKMMVPSLQIDTKMSKELTQLSSDSPKHVDLGRAGNRCRYCTRPHRLCDAAPTKCQMGASGVPLERYTTNRDIIRSEHEHMHHMNQKPIEPRTA